MNLLEFDAALDQLDWADLHRQLDSEGYAVLPGLLRAAVVDALAQCITAQDLFAQWRYFETDLPTPLAEWRTALYRRLAPVANRWNETLAIDARYPATLDEFLRQNRNAGQTRGQSHLYRLRVHDQVPLHQRNAGFHVFPLQIVALLSEPGTDFQGGELVMTEQRPRLQSRPMVVPLKRGDVAIIATAVRPFRGSQGYYRVNLKHAISRVRGGERVGLEVLFHDAPDTQEGGR
ncbi:2OG-Fe(II) oxygenase [Pseudomonas sp. TE24901]|jgi:hypothetical protein